MKFLKKQLYAWNEEIFKLEVELYQEKLKTEKLKQERIDEAVAYYKKEAFK